MKRLVAVPFLTLSLLAYSPSKAEAITAGDFLDRMTTAERTAFIDGAIEMLSYQHAKAGDKQKASCVIDWYYRGGPGPEQIPPAFSKNKGLPAVGILATLINRRCK